MSKVYLADKDTLDTVNNKVGASDDAEASAPITIFSGLKYIIQGVIELKKLLSDGKTAVANAITGKRSYNGNQRSLCHYGGQYNKDIYPGH